MKESSAKHVLEAARIAALSCAAAFGAVGLAGWIFNIRFFKTVLPDSPAMTPGLAVVLVLLSGCAACLKSTAKKMRCVGTLFSIAVLLCSLGWIFFHLLGLAFLPDQLVPAPESAISTLLLSSAVLLYFLNPGRFHKISEIFSLIAAALALISFMGHLTGAKVLYSFLSPSRAKGMSVHSAWAFLCISGSLLLYDQQDGLASVLTTDTAGGAIARRYFPLIFLAPIIIEVLVSTLVHVGVLDPSTHHAFAMILLLGCVLLMTSVTARTIDRVDRERRTATQLLTQNEERYRQLINLAPQGIFTADLNGIYLDVNEGGCALLDYSRDHLVGKAITDLVPPEEIARFRESRALLSKPGIVHRAEWNLRKRDGTFVPVEVSAKILPDGRWYEFVSDISERKKAEAEIATKQAQLDAFFEASPAGMALLDLDLRYLKVNDSLADINGPQVSEHLGRTVQEVLPELAPTVVPIFDQIIRTKKGVIGVEIEGRTRRQPNERRNWIVSYFPIFKEERQVIYLGGIVVEITELKRAQEKLQKQADELRVYAGEVEDLYDHAPCGYHSLGPTGVFIQINQTELDWLGYSRVELIAKKTFKDLLTPEGIKQFDANFPGFLENGFVQNLKYDLKSKSGELIPVLLSATAIMDRNGNFLMSRASVFEYSAQKKLETDLQDALKARDEFLSIAAHELKTPITSLYLQMQILQKLSRESLSIPEALEKHRENGRVVSKQMVSIVTQTLGQVERLTRQVNDLLDLTRIRVGKVRLEISQVDLSEVLTEVLSSYRADLETQGIPVILNVISGATGAWDKRRIDQVVTNLISNAIKYGQRSAIEIDVGVVPERDVVVLSVTDHGMGIPSSLQGKVFERFERAVDTQKIKGLGLGLYITRQMVMAHGGRIWVKSKEGQGATFTVELPRNLSNKELNIARDHENPTAA